MTPSLEPTQDEFRALLQQISELSERVLSTSGSDRASDFSSIESVLQQLQEETPSRAGFEELLSTLELAASKGMNHLHPGFLAFIPISGSPITAIADYLAALFNRYVGVQWASPAMAQLEWNALRWVMGIFDYPEEARGVFTSGGSIANFTAVVTARHDRLGSSHAQGRIYMTDQTHVSVDRAARIAGVDPALIVTVPTDQSLRMDVDALEQLLTRDIKDESKPFLVVANAGTVNTGAVDPIDRIIEVARRHGVWVHVDGAYGGAFVLTSHGRKVLRGIDKADSITIDPHKGLFLSAGMGCVLVRDGAAMRRAHLGDAAYLMPAEEDGGMPPNFTDYSLELTRPFRGLRLWMALKLFGWEPFAEALERNRQLAVDLHEKLSRDPRFTLPWPPDLSTVVFKLSDSDDKLTLELMNRVNEMGQVLLSSTTIENDSYVRACFLSHRTDQTTLEALIESLESALQG